MSNDEDIPCVTSFVTLSTFTEYVKSRRITSHDPRYHVWMDSPEWHLFCPISVM